MTYDDEPEDPKDDEEDGDEGEDDDSSGHVLTGNWVHQSYAER